MIWDTAIAAIVDQVGKHFPSELEKQQAASAIEKIVLDAAAQSEQEITKRWEADAKSDSWLAKNTRPLMLWALFGLVIAEVVCGYVKLVLPDGYVSLTTQAFLAALGAYFVVRGVEKVAKSKYTP